MGIVIPTSTPFDLSTMLTHVSDLDSLVVTEEEIDNIPR
jgi:hypothetical protein